MSPKKKPAPTAKSATKDDLINSLFESESAGKPSSKPKIETKAETISRLSDVHRMSPPPPPPARTDNERIFSFDEDVTQGLPVPSESNGGVYDASKDNTPIPTGSSSDASNRTLSIVRNPEPASEQEEVLHPLSLEEAKTVVHSAQSDDISQSGHEPPSRNKSKLEEVLRRLKPQLGSQPTPQIPSPEKAKTPLFNSETAVAAVDRAKAQNVNVIEGMAPPPVKPVGVVAKAIYSGTNANERAPTEPVGGGRSIDPNADEKTVPQASKPQKAPPKSGFFSRPLWQDAKTEPMSRPRLDEPEADPEAEQFMPTEIRPNSPGVRFRAEERNVQPGAAIFSSAEAALRQSENLRVAQKRISDLENELERVRRENESLRSAGETLRRRMSELQAHAENAELNTAEAKKIAEEERKVLRGQIQSRDRELAEMKGRIDDAETRLEANFRKIRVRERDLEHRIEIIKAESQSITASKDRMILELKRQIDQISSELNHSKTQVQETFGQFKEKQETARRAVRALRIALTVLEGEDDSSRKAE